MCHSRFLQKIVPRCKQHNAVRKNDKYSICRIFFLRRHYPDQVQGTGSDITPLHLSRTCAQRPCYSITLRSVLFILHFSAICNSFFYGLPSIAHEKQLEFHSAVEILPGFVINIFIPEELSLLLRRSQSLCQVPEDRWLLHCRRSDHTSYIASRSPTLLHRRASRWQTDCPRHIFRGDKPS